MYTIVGADGNQYGPVGLEVLRLWLHEGRVDLTTRVLVAGTAEWKLLGQLPEFATAQTQAPPTIAPPRPVSPVVPRTNPMALTGLIFALISVTFGLCCCYGVPFNLAGLIFSIIGAVEIRRDPQHQEGYGLAVAGIVLSLLSLLAGLLIFGLAFTLGTSKWWNPIRHL